MRKRQTGFLIVSLLTILLLLNLGGCRHSRESHAKTMTVTILEGEHYLVEKNQKEITPGGTVVFRVRPEDGYSVAAVDYPGEYRLYSEGKVSLIELIDVSYPTRVRLNLTHYARTITYMANGGKALTKEGDVVTRTYDITCHIRPNVSIGTDLFYRDGYTLTGWNTMPDGSGIRVGLGSRVTVDDTLTLYAGWEKWTDEDFFLFDIAEGAAVITGYTGREACLVIPEMLGGYPVTGIKAYAFAGCQARRAVLPKTLVTIEKEAFSGAALEELCFFDNIEFITDECFSDCKNLSVLRINAIEDPYGYSFRRESVLADKFDLLITTMGEDRLIFYGGCSMWYNLIGQDAKDAFGKNYRILNMACNGVSSSLFQMELLRQFVTEKDILIHTPEISSVQQLLTFTGMFHGDDKLWCAMEYNYDLVSLLDIRVLEGGVLESLRLYLDKKKPGGQYTDVYHDSRGNEFYDENGCIPFLRDEPMEELVDSILLEASYLEDLSRLEEEYAYFTEQGVRIYVSCACVDIDDVPEEEKGNLEEMAGLYEEKFSAMKGVTLISHLEDYVFHHGDYYDTVYHLLTIPARRCTNLWIRDIKAQLTAE